MKTKLFLTSFLSCFFYLVSSQVPQGFNYQAVARNGNGVPITNKSIPVRISIVTSLSGGTVIWQEEHPDVTANQDGLISLVVGTGTHTGGSSSSFAAINWSAQVLYLKTEVKYPASDWTDMGTSQIWAVPYTLMAKNVEGPLTKLGIEGTTSDMEEALFEVKNKSGNTVFAVYNEGVRAYVGDGDAKGVKGGFSVGGFDDSKGVHDLMTVNNDSVRIYIDNANTKGVKGGFSVGGFDQSKAITVRKLFTVSDDSVRIYVNSNPGKGVKGGFSVGGYDNSKGSVIPFVDLTPRNYFIGHEAGSKITTGLYNSFLGYQSGKQNTQGNSNIFIGYQSGYSNTLGEDNTFVGYQAGFNNIGNNIGGVPQHGKYNCYFGYQAGYSSLNGDFNTMIGYNSGKANTASLNTFIGYEAGVSNTEGAYNTFMGVSAGAFNLTGLHNIFMGHQAGYSNKGGNDNIIIGTTAGAAIQSGNNNIIIGSGAVSGAVYNENGTGSSNVIIGYNAGGYSKNGSFNIFIGNQAGYSETGSDKLYIDNSSTSSPLIYGDFASGSKKISVNGNLNYTGALSNISDRRLKSNIQELTDVIAKLLKIRGVSFEWNTEDIPDLVVDKKPQIGVIAQEVEMVFPELVSTNEKGYKMVDYTKLTPILVEAVKEQQQQIDAQQKEINDLKILVNSLITNQKVQINQ
jgi:trimeric autotransporter adhesin